jgi:hypothetical protein
VPQPALAPPAFAAKIVAATPIQTPAPASIPPLPAHASSAARRDDLRDWCGYKRENYGRRAEIAKAIGVTRGSIGDYLSGSLPGYDVGLKLREIPEEGKAEAKIAGIAPPDEKCPALRLVRLA